MLSIHITLHLHSARSVGSAQSARFVGSAQSARFVAQSARFVAQSARFVAQSARSVTQSARSVTQSARFQSASETQSARFQSALFSGSASLASTAGEYGQTMLMIVLESDYFHTSRTNQLYFHDAQQQRGEQRSKAHGV